MPDAAVQLLTDCIAHRRRRLLQQLLPDLLMEDGLGFLLMEDGYRISLEN